MSSESARFERGQQVQRVNQPEQVGTVADARWDGLTETWLYEVQFGVARRTLPQSALQPFQLAASPWDALAAGNYSGLRHFVSRLDLPSAAQASNPTRLLVRDIPYRVLPAPVQAAAEVPGPPRETTPHRGRCWPRQDDRGGLHPAGTQGTRGGPSGPHRRSVPPLAKVAQGA